MGYKGHSASYPSRLYGTLHRVGRWGEDYLVLWFGFRATSLFFGVLSCFQVVIPFRFLFSSEPFGN